MGPTDAPPGTPPRLRRARATDLPLLYRTALNNIRKIEPDRVDAWIDATDTHLELWTNNLPRAFVAEVDGAAAGIALWMGPGGRGNADREALLITLQVDGAFRRRGVAHALLDGCVHDAGDRGFEMFVVGVHHHDPARLLYERLGFAPLADRGDPVDARPGGGDVVDAREADKASDVVDSGDVGDPGNAGDASDVVDAGDAGARPGASDVVDASEVVDEGGVLGHRIDDTPRRPGYLYYSLPTRP